MDYKQTLLETSMALKAQLTKMIETRRKQASENLPTLPPDLEALADRLGKTDFTIVVSGEVNRGKSTFTNAIIGNSILPTFDKETTSQVFKIKNSKTVSYSVIYDNGEVISIGREDLVKYGTQVDDAVLVDGSSTRRILYIEICTPIQNLPEGVTIVDTPGIGSTFKSHTEIAKGFMQHADAIIYLCSSKHPIVKIDVDFIRNVILPLRTSPNVLFVMSKADQADSEAALTSLIARAEAQLVENFSDNNSIGKKVLPVDSMSLIQSNNAKNQAESEAFRNVSGFAAIHDAIVNLIDRQKFMWLVLAYNAAAQYYKKVSSFLDKQLSEYELNESSRTARLQDINARLTKFESDFGHSHQRHILEQINNVLISMKDTLKVVYVSNKSPLLAKYNDKVDAMAPRASSTELNQAAEQLSHGILDDAMAEWEKIYSTALSEVQKTLMSYHKDCQVLVNEEYSLENVNIDNPKIDMNISFSDRWTSMRGQYFSAYFGYLGATFATSAIASVTGSSTLAGLATILQYPVYLLGPIGWAIAGSTFLIGIFYGNRKAKERAVKQGKEQIKGHLSEILREIYDKLTKASLLEGKHQSILALFDSNIREGATEAIANIYAATKNELEASRNGLLLSANPATKTKVINQQALWDGYAKAVKALQPAIKSIDEATTK